MISINIHYSNDRLSLFEIFLSELKKLDLFYLCELIICSDGPCNLNGYKIIEIPRNNNQYCRAYAWLNGIKASSFDTILYLDCDRILPRNFLKLISDIPDNAVVFPANHFRLMKNESLTSGKKRMGKHESNSKWFNLIPRTLEAKAGFKNPWSGCTAFKKSLFKKIYPDDRFTGMRYADVDMTMQCMQANINLTPLDCADIHLYHEPHFDSATMDATHLQNGIRYCKKWRIPLDDILVQQASKLIKLV